MKCKILNSKHVDETSNILEIPERVLTAEMNFMEDMRKLPLSDPNPVR